MEAGETVEKSIQRALKLVDSDNRAKVSRGCASIDRLLMKVCGSQVQTLRKRRTSNQELTEFLALQDSFAYNIVGRLSLRLGEFVLDADGDDPGAVDTAVLLLHTLQGLCLVHRYSRLTFNNDRLLGTLLSCTKHPVPKIQVAAINALVAVMVRQVENIRRFESLQGPKVITTIFKNRQTSKQVKLCIIEFLFFYLIPETRYPEVDRTVPRKGTAAKQQLLGCYLSNVDGLVRELEVSQPFGSMDLEW